MPHDTSHLIRRLIGGDAEARSAILDRARSDAAAEVLVAAALLSADEGLLARADRAAVDPRDRQLVAIAAAHLDHDEDRFDALVRDHLADHPDSLLAAWIAAAHRPAARRAASSSGSTTQTTHTTHQE